MAEITRLQCDRCLSKGIECNLEATGACKRCRDAKLGCSMMPHHVGGKANRKALTQKAVFKYRLAQLKERSNSGVDKKGKGSARKRQEDPEPEATGSGTSPSTLPLGGMTLGSGSSIGDSPAPEPTMSKHLLPKPGFSVEVSAPPRPRIVVPSFDQLRQPSPSGISQSSDDTRNLMTRVAALEDRMGRFEEWKKEVDRKFKEINM